MDSRNRALGERRGGNLALKAKAVELEEEEGDGNDSCVAWSAEDITTAKEAWDALTDTFIGNAIMRHNKFEEVINEAEVFLMED